MCAFEPPLGASHRDLGHSEGGTVFAVAPVGALEAGSCHAVVRLIQERLRSKPRVS